MEGVANRKEDTTLVPDLIHTGRLPNQFVPTPNPIESMHRAQTAPTGLDVHLLEEERLTLPYPTFLFGEKLEERSLATKEKRDLTLELDELLSVAMDETRAEQRAQRLYVLRCSGHSLLDRAHGMANLDPGIPQGIEHLAHHVWCRMAQDHDVDVGLKTHLRPAVSPRGDHGPVLGIQPRPNLDYQRVDCLREYPRQVSGIAGSFRA